MYVYQAEAERSKLEGLEKFYHIIAWGIPLILLVVAISADVFGDSGQWCWISPDYQWARVALYVNIVFDCEVNHFNLTKLPLQIYYRYYFWLILILILNGIMFYVIIKYNPLQSSATAAGSRVSRNFRSNNPLAFRLRLYLLAFICTKVFSVINRVQNIADSENPIFALYLLQALFEPFTGFANALVYGANRMVIREYKRKWDEYKKNQAAKTAAGSSYESHKTTTTTSAASTKTTNDIEMNMDMTPSPSSTTSSAAVVPVVEKKKKHPHKKTNATDKTKKNIKRSRNRRNKLRCRGRRSRRSNNK